MNLDFSKELIDNNLQLRLLKPDDKTSIYEIYSDEESASLDSWIAMKELEEAEELIKISLEDFESKSELRYAIVDKETKKLVGSCGLFGFDEWNQKCMIFYQISHKERNKGYATGAIKLLAQYAFTKIGCNRLEAYITPGNVSSVRVLEKNGYIYEGLQREMEFYKDQFWDGIVMAMIKSDFDSLEV